MSRPEQDSALPLIWAFGLAVSALAVLAGFSNRLLRHAEAATEASFRVESTNPCTQNAGDCYSIQGLYSKPGCPGQRVETVEVDGRSYFLECF